jgi:hypothetical protein
VLFLLEISGEVYAGDVNGDKEFFFFFAVKGPFYQEAFHLGSCDTSIR